MGDVSLQTGWLPWLILALGGVAGVFLLCRPQRSWWLCVVPIAVVIAAVAAWLIGDVGGEKLFAKPLNTSDDVWIAVALTRRSAASTSLNRRMPWTLASVLRALATSPFRTTLSTTMTEPRRDSLSAQAK